MLLSEASQNDLVVENSKKKKRNEKCENHEPNSPESFNDQMALTEKQVLL